MSSPHTLTGGEDPTRAGGSTALSLCTGSEASNPTPSKDTQPDRIQEGGKSVRFSPILQLFEESGEESFETDFMRDIQKELRPVFQNEVWDDVVSKLHKSTLTKDRMVPEDQE